MSSGTSVPWPNLRLPVNSARDRVWVKGDDGYVHELTLSYVNSAPKLVAELVVRERSWAELALSGITEATTGTNAYLKYAEQPTGAVVQLSGTNPAKILSVNSAGNVYQKAYSGTISSPPLHMYLGSKTVETTLDWEDPNSFGLAQNPPVAAIQSNGQIAFVNNGTLVPGSYRLLVVSGNIGKVDSDFDGFNTLITVGDVIIEGRLCTGIKGADFSGTNTFEFEVEDTIQGEWLLSFDWTNNLDDPNRGTKRQLKISNYVLEHLATTLYKVSLGASSAPVLTALDTDTYSPLTPGGWVATVNSYGTAVSWAHESQLYSSNDTLTSKSPLADVLTSSTHARREDLVLENPFVTADSGTTALPTFSGVSVAVEGAPLPSENLIAVYDADNATATAWRNELAVGDTNQAMHATGASGVLSAAIPAIGNHKSLSITDQFSQVLVNLFGEAYASIPLCCFAVVKLAGNNLKILEGAHDAVLDKNDTALHAVEYGVENGSGVTYNASQWQLLVYNNQPVNDGYGDYRVIALGRYINAPQNYYETGSSAQGDLGETLKIAGEIAYIMVYKNLRVDIDDPGVTTADNGAAYEFLENRFNGGNPFPTGTAI